MLGINSWPDSCSRWIMELRFQTKHHQRMKDYYLSKAVEAEKRGDKAAARIYEEQAIANEKTRILTLKSLHTIEQAEAERKLAENLRKTAKQVRKAHKDINGEKVRKTIVDSVSILSGDNEAEQIVTEAMDIALQEGNLEPSIARTIVHKEFEAKLKSELEPASELEKIRAQLNRESEREDI